MLQRLGKNIAKMVAVLAVLVAPLALVPAVVSAQATDPIRQPLKCGSSGLDFSESNCEVGAGTTGINTLITNIINVFSVVVGIISVIMIIYGGFRYVTSGGDSGNVGNAKTTIIYAVVGLVIVAVAQFIVQFVLDKFANSTT